MFCSKCGTKIKDGSKFCSNCGNIVSNENFNDNTSLVTYAMDLSDGRDMSIPAGVLNCKSLKVEDKKIEFSNEADENIVIVNKTSKGMLEPLALEFNGMNNDGSYETFMTSKHTASNSDTIYDKEGNIIGSSLFNGHFKSIVKTVIKLKDKDGNEYVLEEKVGLIRGLLKVIIPDYGILAPLSGRTGKMVIKKGNKTIGMIDSVRGRVVNTYIVKDCAAIREHIDLRLIILGMTVKCYNVK